MAKFVNRAKMTTATTGTGTITLGSAVAGYQSFADAGVSDADVVRYVIEDGDDWEIGTGTYTASGTTLSRTVDESSNSDAELNLTGNALVFVTAAAADLDVLDGLTATTAELNILDGVTATTAEINYLDITSLGTSEASKAVTTDANGVTIFDGGVVEDDTTITSSTGAATINCRDGNVFSHTLTEDVTYTFSNAPASGRAFGFTLKVVQDSTARTITWPASVDWPAATAPTLSTGSGEVDVFVFFTTDGGTTFYGFTAGQVLS